MDPKSIIAGFYSKGSRAYNILINHGMKVAQKAIEIVNNSSKFDAVNKDFIVEASFLHDIGICMTSCNYTESFKSLPYLCHGFEGKKILDDIGLHEHGLVCERHVGLGLSSEDIVRMGLPLPHRDMIPVSLEEKLVCYADKFFSKNLKAKEKNIEAVLTEISNYGDESIKRFLEFHSLFS